MHAIRITLHLDLTVDDDTIAAAREHAEDIAATMLDNPTGEYAETILSSITSARVGLVERE